jgi:hypothetical protein
MKTSVSIKEKEENHETLGKGNYAIDRAGGLYLIIQVNEETFNVFPFRNSRYYECLPKKDLKPFYGTITITVER